MRLPLGAAWRGKCNAPGYEAHSPSNHELEACNLGYAHACLRLPNERACDAIRFGVTRESSTSISLQYVMEAAHQPAGQGGHGVRNTGDRGGQHGNAGSAEQRQLHCPEKAARDRPCPRRIDAGMG